MMKNGNGHNRCLPVVWRWAAIVPVVTPVSALFAQPVAYIGVIGGEGALRLPEGTAISVNDLMMLERQFQQSISPGEGVRTQPDGTLSLVLPDYGAVALLEPNTELHFADPPVADAGVDFVMTVTAGRVVIVQRPSSKRWLIVAAGPGPAVGYSASQGSSLAVDVDDKRSIFSARDGSIRFFAGAIPQAKLADEKGQWLVPNGLVVPEGQRVTSQAPAAIEADGQAGTLVTDRWSEDVLAFANVESGFWLTRAEKGDFTPVKGAERGAPQLLQDQTEPSLAFDQPRPVLTTPAAQVQTNPIQATLSTTQRLFGSSLPGTAIAAQRLLRSRIIGNPGTSGTGALQVNSAAGRLIVIGGRRGGR